MRLGLPANVDHGEETDARSGLVFNHMTRLMKNAGFRAEQWAGRYDFHVEPINRPVDSLILEATPADKGWMPYVAPWHGGTNARVLSILRDPGPKTHKDGGSGMLCIENDDPTAAKQCELFLDKLDVRDVTPWNAYPWYINKPPTSRQVTEGAQVLERLIALMPDLRVVLLQGGHAQEAWRKFLRVAPRTVAGRGLIAVPTFHPGNQALQTSNPVERQQRIARRIEAIDEVVAVLNG